MPSSEIQGILRDARATLRELVEEGVDRFPTPAPIADRPQFSGGSAAGNVPIEAGENDQLSLENVRRELGECTRCALSGQRTQIVFGDGNADADLVFVGEGPGEQEDLRGIPFCGRAGELLTDMIEKGLKISRSSVYICNVVKCRPPRNRTPLAEEIAACRPFLDGQLQAVGPKVIVALGRPAASLLIGREIRITKVRGVWHEYRGIPVMPTFHPAFLLRQYTQENRRLVWEDLQAAYAKITGTC